MNHISKNFFFFFFSHSSITCTVHFLTSLKLTHAHSVTHSNGSYTTSAVVVVVRETVGNNSLFFLLPYFYFPSGGETNSGYNSCVRKKRTKRETEAATRTVEKRGKDTHTHSNSNSNNVKVTYVQKRKKREKESKWIANEVKNDFIGVKESKSLFRTIIDTYTSNSTSSRLLLGRSKVNVHLFVFVVVVLMITHTPSDDDHTVMEEEEEGERKILQVQSIK